MEVVRYTKEDGSVPFSDWLNDLRDLRAKIAIRRRIDRLGQGNPGDTRPLRCGVSELRIDVGPGYRAYYAIHGQVIVLLLCGGDKRTQRADIEKAVGFWEEWKFRSRSCT